MQDDEVVKRAADVLMGLGLHQVESERVSMGICVAREWLREHTPRPADKWDYDDGNVIWWRLPVEEPPYVGTPYDDDWVEDYYTHWTPLPIPLGAGNATAD